MSDASHRAFVDAILKTWAHAGDYALRLVADVKPEEMVAQPVDGVTMNHPAWVLGHLSAYPPVLSVFLRGDQPEDPAGHPYGRDSKPEPSPDAYPPKDDLVRTFQEVREDAARALGECTRERLDGPPPFERWAPRFPTARHAVMHLMTHHEAVHLGQLSAWRRAGKRPPV